MSPRYRDHKHIHPHGDDIPLSHDPQEATLSYWAVISRPKS